MNVAKPMEEFNSVLLAVSVILSSEMISFEFTEIQLGLEGPRFNSYILYIYIIAGNFQERKLSQILQFCDYLRSFLCEIWGT